MTNKKIIGDGLYAEDDGQQFRLYCARGNMIHEVYLNVEVTDAFLLFIAESRSLKITIEPVILESSSEVEQLAVNQLVEGSNPPSPAKKKRNKKCHAARQH